jgi:hypothetical protein
VSPDRDGLIPPDLGVGNQIVARQRPHRLVRQRPDWTPRHRVRDKDAQEPQRISNQCHPLSISPLDGAGQQVAHRERETALGPDQVGEIAWTPTRFALISTRRELPRTS